LCLFAYPLCSTGLLSSVFFFWVALAIPLFWMNHTILCNPCAQKSKVLTVCCHPFAYQGRANSQFPGSHPVSLNRYRSVYFCLWFWFTNICFLMQYLSPNTPAVLNKCSSTRDE
jgi:hypothetical protein